MERFEIGTALLFTRKSTRAILVMLKVIPKQNTGYKTSFSEGAFLLPLPVRPAG